MGKSKPTKWFKAVKKAFRSPSKERPSSPDHQDTKVDGDEKLLSKQNEHSPVRHPEPTPHPLPSFEIITHDEAETEHSNRGQPFPQPLPTPEAVDPTIAAAAPSEKALEDVIEEEDDTSNNDVEAPVVEKKQQEDDDDSISEEEEAAARIQQRFSEPLALKGLVRLQALVRGHQVRRQAATTLQTMEAIVRVQAVFRGRRVRVSKDGRAVRSRISKRRRLSSRAGHHGDASRGGYQFNEPQIIRGEQEEGKHKRPTAYLLTQQLKRSAPKRSTLFIDCDPSQPHWGWAWLELWSNARPWEIRNVGDSKGSKGSKGSTNSKDFIEIIPSRKNSEYTTKEVDVNTLKVKYYEDYVSNPTPAAKSRSSNPMSEKKEPSGKSSAGPMYEKKEPVKHSSPMQQHEKKEPAVKSLSPMQQFEKKEPVVKSSSPMLEKKEPVVKSSSPMFEKKESTVKSSSPMFEKKEPFKSSEKKEPTVKSTSSPKEPFNKSSSHMLEKKEAARSSEKKEPFRSARHLPEKKEFVRSSSSPLSEKKESIRSSWTSPLSEKKEPLRSPTSSSFSEKKEPLRSPPSPFSEKKEPLRSPSSPFSDQKELARSPSSPLSEKTEPDWPQMLSPVPTPTPPPATLNPHSHRVLPKPPPIEVPTLPATELEEDSRPIQILDPRTPEVPKSPKSMSPSPAASDNSLPVPPSPLASDASLPVPETPPGVDSAGDDPSVTMEHLALSEAHSTNGGETNGTLNGETHSRSCSLSVSNGEHQPGDDAPSAKGSTSEVANGHSSNGHQENGGSKSPKVDKAGENGDSPVPSKRPTCRYMVPTESAKAKFRSSSNPKTRAPDAPDSPVRTTPKRYSIGGSPTVSKGTDSPKTAFGTRKTHSFQSRATPSPKAGTPKEKPRSMETGAESPARRSSLGGDKRWRT